jgi:hypothetical protein
LSLFFEFASQIEFEGRAIENGAHYHVVRPIDDLQRLGG